MSAVQRLIEKFVPENYNLFLDLSRKEKSFKGLVKIKGQALAKDLAFHQRDLQIESVKIAGQSLEFKVDNEKEQVQFTYDKLGDVTVEIAFSGKITDNMDGIYPSYYTLDGEKKELLGTQFESHFARQAFPSIDEPEAKATFDLSLKFDEETGDIALSNMPEIEIENRRATGVWKFATTPRMSSYLLAFVCGNLQGKTTTTKHGTLVGSYATRAHDSQSLDFSLDIAVKAIEFYEDYFGVRYPIPQCLHVALPDFSSGAMENWGLITYREIYLLVDENSTLASRQQVALVIAHEVAHQWFGNLVTMTWWDDLWLNESFANMMEYVAVDAIKPDWHIIEDFQTVGVPAALERDATDGVQAVHVAVQHPDEINTLFDPAIVYAKGSRLMHMLRRWLGDKNFAQGLADYFEKYKYSNTIGKNLWDALSHVSGRDVAAFMDSWLEQPGYPVVTLCVENATLKISQSQFFIGEHTDKSRLWQIPLNSNWTGLPEILSERQIEIPNYSQLLEKNDGVLRLNTQNTAHYVINYEGELYESVLADLPNLDSLTKLQVVQERLLLAKSGLVSVASLLSLFDKLAGDKTNLVAAATTKLISTLSLFVDENSPEELALKTLIIQTVKGNYERLGFEPKPGESEEDELVRQNVLANLFYADDADVIKEANAIFERYTQDIEKIPAAIRYIVLANQMKHNASRDLVETYLAYYTKTTDSNFKNDLSGALSYVKDKESLDVLLSKWQDKDVVKPQDLAKGWYLPFLNKAFTQEATWTWVRENWDWIKASLGGDMSFDRFVIYAGDAFKTQMRLEEYKAFFEPQLTDLALSRSISMGIKQIEARTLWIENEKAGLGAALLTL